VGIRDLVQRRRPARQPVLSVVVPLYQVEEYLAECLDSLLATTYRPLEVVIVDDGSTDRSAAIAATYAARFERCRTLTQPNAGLGAARNTGIRAATGDYLAFLDSDDRVPPEAYAAMVEVLTETGSDFVAGSVLRLEGGQLSEPGWMSHLHRARRLGITIDDHPEVIGDGALGLGRLDDGGEPEGQYRGGERGHAQRQSLRHRRPPSRRDPAQPPFLIWSACSARSFPS